MAKYPFTPQAADHVQKLDLKITELDNPEYSRVVERAEKRVEEAILNPLASDQILNDEIEILSFPISIFMVAAINDSFLKRRFALAEAKRAYNILKRENKQKIAELAQIFNWKIRLAGKDAAINQAVAPDFAVYFTNFLKNTGNFHETKWKLVNRKMVNGEVYLAKDEAARLLSEEVRAHIEKKLETKIEVTLPQTVSTKIERLKQVLIGRKSKIHQEEMPTETVPEAFPPCIGQLYNMAPSGKHISHIGRFALTSFLVSTGMPIENVVECFRPTSDFSEKLTRYQVEHIAGGRGSRTKYIPPKCDTLRTHGVCPGMDETCRRVRHPLAYYRRKLRTLKTPAKATTQRA